MRDYDPIGTIEFFRERHRIESATTLRLLAAIPDDGLSYSPHPLSSSAGSTAWTIVRCLRVCNDLTRSCTAAMTHEKNRGHSVLIEEFNAASILLTEQLLALEQKDWVADRSVTSEGGILLLSQSLGQILWLFHVDSIHHRGQLSTYLRVLGAKVPSIYGPSGDYPAGLQA